MSRDKGGRVKKIAPTLLESLPAQLQMTMEVEESGKSVFLTPTVIEEVTVFSRKMP